MPSSYTTLYNSAGVPIIGGELIDERPQQKVRVMPQYDFTIVREGPWISRRGLPCAEPTINANGPWCVVRPHNHSLPKVMRSRKYYAEYTVD